MKPNTTQHNNMNNFLSHHHNILLLLLFLLSFSSSSSSSSHQLTLRQQASILVSLKHSFKLSNSSSSSFDSWNLSNTSSLCFWPGIQCDDTKQSVVSLNISNSNISTTLSPLITLIPTLVNLSVSDNNFSGAFPFSNIHHLPNLRLLNISNNLFSGELDWDFSRLQNLVVLDAYNNNFNGSLPYGVTFLPNLAYLNFAGNYFSGSIPRSYGNMGKLKFLSLAGNDLSGSIPSELGSLTSLEQLYLGYYNEFEGGIPGELGKLVNLFHLDLSSCGLEGPIPPELGNLKKLDTLFLQINQLSGSVPSQLGNLSSLRSLDLSNNGLTGEISAELVSGLSELTLMNLFMNKFHGEIPNAIAELPKLAVLKLWQNNFTGAIPTELGQNGELTEVDLSTNKLTGTVPKSMCFGRKLKILILLNNFLFGPLPNDLGQCETLVRVRMGQNYLTGTLPNGFLYLPNLSLLELQNNYLSGQLEQQQKTPNKVPSSKLSLLNLSNNRLSGQIPTSLIGNFLSSLQIVLLTGNQFSGEIPSEIGHLKKTLFKLDISRNKLRGKIPPTIANCVLLTYLDLSQNQLTGPIPPELSQIHILNYLNLSWNNLSQGLPKELGTLKSLTSADFSHNNLSGPIPETGQYLFFNSTSFIGNPNLFSNNNNNNHSLSPSDQQHPDPDSNNQNDAVLRSHSSVPSKFKLMFALGLLLCSFVFATFAIVKTRKSRRGKEGHSWKLTAFQKVEFRSSDILECVKDNNVIGRGGAGVVYRGNLPSGEQVAVKKLLGSANKLGGSSHHDNGLAAEIQTLGKIRHRNIVRLLAFCSNRETNLLVYEFMENGSLGEVLHGKGGGYLKWETRLKIAIEAAKGLSYLHHDCSPLILHRDVKSNNILLNSEYEAHVADFGLAKFLRADNGTSECMSAIAGSYGYIAPEYAYTLKVDEKSDVYSFGVVLLELLTGRRPVGDFGEEGVVDIVQWAKTKTSDHRHDHHRRRHQDLTNSITSSSTSSQDEGVVVVKMLDQRLSRDETPLEEAMQVFFVAMLCVQEQSVERPTMREVVQMLAQAKQTSFHF